MARAAAALLVAAVLAVVSMSAGASSNETAAQQSLPFSGWYTGSATFYGGPQDSATTEYDVTISSGSCGYGDIDPKLWPFYLVAGLSPTNPIVQNLRQHACGSCIEIECTAPTCHAGVGSVQALITDECAVACNNTQVNLHVFGFEMLAPSDLGKVSIRYRLVACQPVDPITIHVDAYRVSGGGWLRLALKSVAGDGQVTSIELAPAAVTDLNDSATYKTPTVFQRGGSNFWRSMTNTYGAVWELNGVPPPPLHMRVTNARGQTIVIANAIHTAGLLGDIESQAQFPMPTSAAQPPSPLVPPAGAYLAPGTDDILVFQGANPAPLPVDTDGGNSTANGTAATPNSTSAPAAAAGVAQQPATADPTGAAGGADAGKKDAASNSANMTYTVAGFSDANGDGVADDHPDVIGMPAAPNATAAPNASAGATNNNGAAAGKQPLPAGAAGAHGAAGAAPVPLNPAVAPDYTPAPADAGGPGRVPRRVLRQLMLLFA